MEKTFGTDELLKELNLLTFKKICSNFFSSENKKNIETIKEMKKDNMNDLKNLFKILHGLEKKNKFFKIKFITEKRRNRNELKINIHFYLEKEISRNGAMILILKRLIEDEWGFVYGLTPTFEKDGYTEILYIPFSVKEKTNFITFFTKIFTLYNNLYFYFYNQNIVTNMLSTEETENENQTQTQIQTQTQKVNLELSNRLKAILNQRR